jgi:uncharacterized OB-fold protein
MADVLPFRVLPEITPLNEAFWTGGRDGELRLLRCASCDYFIHPPTPRCPRCLSTDVGPQAVSGRATLHSFTVNHQQWIPGADPYVIGLVTLDEQDDLRLTTNIVECSPDDVHIGMALEVSFVNHDDVWFPLFRPMPRQ